MLCAACAVPEHDTCPLVTDCTCCADTIEGIEEGR